MTLRQRGDTAWAEIWRWTSFAAILAGVVLVASHEEVNALGCWLMAIFGELRAQSRLGGTG